jgi:hypothetical protein
VPSHEGTAGSMRSPMLIACLLCGIAALAWLAALIGLVLVALAARIGIPWYFGTHLGLDNGIGG